MTTQFNKWWDGGELMHDNPYLEGTPIWWAWEGWVAASIESKIAADKIELLTSLLARYRDETPLGNQPHMIAHQVDDALGRIPDANAAVAEERERCARIVDDMVRAVDGVEALEAIRCPTAGLLGEKQDHAIFWPTQCNCGHLFLKKYQFAELTKEGNIGFCWCGFCRTKRMVKPTNADVSIGASRKSASTRWLRFAAPPRRGMMINTKPGDTMIRITPPRDGRAGYVQYGTVSEVTEDKITILVQVDIQRQMEFNRVDGTDTNGIGSFVVRLENA